MPTYLGTLSPISPLSNSLVGLPWAADDQSSDTSSIAGPSRRPATITARPSTSRAATAPSLHGPRAPRRSLHATSSMRNENKRPSTSAGRLQVCTNMSTLRPLPAPPPCTPVTPYRSSCRPLPRPPNYPSRTPTPSGSGSGSRAPTPSPEPTPEPKVDGTLERQLIASGKQVLRLDIPDSFEPGIIIISPLSFSSPDLLAPPISETTSTEESLRIYESRRRRTSSTYRYREALQSYARKPTLPRIDVEHNESVDGDSSSNEDAVSDGDWMPPVKPFAVQEFALSPIEKYYESDSAVLTDVNNFPPPRPRRPTDESYIVDVPLDDGPSPRKKGHGRIASDLSKKFKRYSCKWIREKKGKRWVEEDYGQVLQKLRRLK